MALIMTPVTRVTPTWRSSLSEVVPIFAGPNQYGNGQASEGFLEGRDIINRVQFVSFKRLRLRTLPSPRPTLAVPKALAPVRRA